MFTKIHPRLLSLKLAQPPPLFESLSILVKPFSSCYFDKKKFSNARRKAKFVTSERKNDKLVTPSLDIGKKKNRRSV
jgi:hypothetical protein